MVLIPRMRTAFCLAAWSVVQFFVVGVTLTWYAPDLDASEVFIRAYWSANGVLSAGIAVALFPAASETKPVN